MKNSKTITFLIKAMSGGGAERVISLLSKAVADLDYSVYLVLTHQSKQDAMLYNIDSRINVISLPDELKKGKKASILPKLIMLFARIINKLGKTEKSSVLKYYSRNFYSVSYLKKHFKKHKNSTAVAFLYDSIFLTLLAKTKETKVIISERGDPEQTTSKTVKAFMQTEFQKADNVVFQSPDVQKWYNKNTAVKGKVIFNPVKPDLPEPFNGESERRKRIVNFCRISPEKNIPMLIDSFSLLHRDHPEYELYIYGDAAGDLVEGYEEEIKKHISDNNFTNSVHMLPARNDIHEEIRDYAMFVSTSDFEGMSNSMLEAMALGLPCVCTDCPAGGARAIIKNGENGLLVPIKDAEKCYMAMKQLIENPELTKKLSENAVKIRNDLSIDKIVKEWMEIING